MESVDVADMLEAAGLELIDKRASNGRLWVKGGESLGETLKKLAPESRFAFTPSGGKATGYEPGWYLMESNS
jgi:hypothetical protein